MKLTSTILAAVMIFALAGQAAEARDHHNWRNNNKNWNQKNWNQKNWKQQNKWNNQWKRSWNNNNSGNRARPWDTMENRSQYALQLMNAQNRNANPYLYPYGY